MRIRLLFVGLIVLTAGAVLHAQASLDVIGLHNLGPNGYAAASTSGPGAKSPIAGTRVDMCGYCHAPHSGLNKGLWNQQLTTESYTYYKSTTEKNVGRAPIVGDSSNQCLSCHDGTVAPGTTVVYGKDSMSGSMYTNDLLGVNNLGTPNGNMQPSHPFSLTTPLSDKVDIAAALANGKTADPLHAVHLVKGSVECTSCHNPHVQAKDKVSTNFLVRESSGGSLCLACHDPNRTQTGSVNQLADWSTSAHALSASKLASTVATSTGLGSYGSVGANACISCHAPHGGATSGGYGLRLLRAANEQACFGCHSGGTNISPAAPNVFIEYTGTNKNGHPFPSSTNVHDDNEPGLLTANRHATCVDCHDAHASQSLSGTTYPGAPATRVTQKDVAGISEMDGTTVLPQATNQYQNCLRCHGNSTGKQSTPITFGYLPARLNAGADPLNLIPQLNVSAASSHPVMHPRGSNTQPSLLSNMLNQDGKTQNRSMGAGSQIFCTDCHNSDDNREFGGSGANGPHGSIYPHVLERNYQSSQVAAGTGPGFGPGTPIVTNLFPTPDLSTAGPYALCAKCHDLTIVLNQNGHNTSWAGHSNHVSTDGISCSVCHSAHGAQTPSGGNADRLVSFDLAVVGPALDSSSNPLPITYVSGTAGTNSIPDTCTLTCHGYQHTSGGATPALRHKGIGIKK